MSFQNYDFISPEHVFAKVKETLASYFDAGTFNDALFPTYVDECLRKLKVLVLREEEAVIKIDNFKGRLPDDFSKLKYAMLCQDPISYQTKELGITQIYSKAIVTYDCDGSEVTTVTDHDVYETIEAGFGNYKVVLQKPYLLKVNYGSRKYCTDDCSSFNANSIDEIKIQGKTITTNFRENYIFIKYFSRPHDEYGPLIPDIEEVERYVEAHIKYSLFEQLFNSTTDETFNQVATKMNFYNTQRLNTLQAALNYLKLWSTDKAQSNINKNFKKYHKFIIK